MLNVLIGLETVRLYCKKTPNNSKPEYQHQYAVLKPVDLSLF